MTAGTFMYFVALTVVFIVLRIFHYASRDGSEVGFIVSMVVVLIAMLLFAEISGDNHQGYASNRCAPGTYRLATMDDSNNDVVYITVRDYKDYALRLCAIDRAKVNFAARVPTNVRIVNLPDGLHLRADQ